MNTEMDTVDTLLLDLGDVHLRRPELSDVPMIASAVQESLRQLQPWMAWATDDYGHDHAHQWVESVRSHDDHELLILDTDDETMLGAAGLNRIDRVHRVANLGYWLGVSAAGRGIATRVSAELALYGFNDLALERVEIRMSVNNEHSTAVAERLGATYEGRLRRALRLRDGQHDAYLYSLVRSDREHLRTLVNETSHPVA
jgi:RimJ/RimL family protein N-acetyltransferase